MGKLENEMKVGIRNSRIQRAVLASIGLVGLVAWAALAPNTIKLLKNFDKKIKYQEKTIAGARRRLLEKGLVAYDGKFLRLTDKGKEILARFDRQNYEIEKPKKWDRKWRVLIFDIPEYRKSLRDKIRRTLISIGFKRMQDSVWVYPYPCEDLITLFKADFKIGRDLQYLIVDKIEYDRPFLEYFGLVDYRR